MKVEQFQSTNVIDALNRATRLARKGEFLRAEDLLTKLPDIDRERTEVIDLLARINIRQGKYDRAQALWLQILPRDPANIHFLNALTACAYRKKSNINLLISQNLWLLFSFVIWYLSVLTLFIIMSERI